MVCGIRIKTGPITNRTGDGSKPATILFVGWWYTHPLKNMSSSVGMMTFPIYIYIYGKIIHSCSKPPTKSSSYSRCWFIAYSPLFTMTTQTTILPSSSHHYVNQTTNQIGISISGMSSTLGFTTSPSTAADTSASSEVTSVSAWWKKMGKL